MASLSMISSKLSLMIFLCVFSFLILHGISTDYDVGDNAGWKVPPKTNNQVYNVWAEKNRFKVNDTLHFRYSKDSIVVVATKEEYEKCVSSKPLFFYNKGDTTFLLDRGGLFYFISGIAAHCERGQRMIIKVLDVESPDDDDQQPGAGESPDDKDKKKNGATHLGVTNFASLMIMVLMINVAFLGMA